MISNNNKPKFSKPPLSLEEKERKAEQFLNFQSIKDVVVKNNDKTRIRTFKKEEVKVTLLRLPKTLAEDITEISALTGLSMNGICVELLRPAIKQKLKELTEE